MKNFNRQLVEAQARGKENTSHFNSASLYISNQNQPKGGSALLLIDPQYDFVHGSLAVPGAEEDCKNIAKFITDNLDSIQSIYCTLDSHMNYHIAHPRFWRNRQGKHPEPFTQITYDQVKDGEWSPVHKKMQTWALTYTKSLEQPRLEGLEGFILTIWPPHCLIGTRGHNVEQHIAEALAKWENHNASMVHYIMKGNNSKTEHYSAFRAEVIVEEDPGTYFNEQLYVNLSGHSKIFVAGEAKSHCVNFTVRDLVHRMGSKKAIDKVILLEKGMSSVPGCDKQGDKFMSDMMSLTPKGGLRMLTLGEERVFANGLSSPRQRSMATSAKKQVRQVSA